MKSEFVLYHSAFRVHRFFCFLFVEQGAGAGAAKIGQPG